MEQISTPSFREDDISQVPALLLLQALGYVYLSPDQALQFRNNKTSQVLLTEVLRRQLRQINEYEYKGQSHRFSENNLTNAIYALESYPKQNGYLASNQYIFDLLTLGKSLEENIAGDKKSFTLQYIDWKHPECNVWHVTEELGVQRSGRTDHYRPDVVLYVNGIPLVVIECKRPDSDKPLSKAVSQHLRNQSEEGIRPLYVYAQLLLSIWEADGRYATNETTEEFWAKWREQFRNQAQEVQYKTTLQGLKNRSMNERSTVHKLYHAGRKDLPSFLGKGDAGGNWIVTLQDELLYNLCRRDRLFDLLYNFTVFDAGSKIIARYQQYFGVRKTLERVKTTDAAGRRQGGVIWHTQGSGKSYTMVMLAQLLAAEPAITNPKIILVTDRAELDDQIYKTFYRCGKEVLHANTGEKLVEYLEDSSDAVLATLIHKFDAAVKKLKAPITRPNVFVLVDEGHRTQYGTLHVKMQTVFPEACFIAFTGTPLMKREKSTAGKFGGIIDAYTVTDAVADGAVVPLLYEGRAPIFSVNERPLDNYFNLIAKPLNEYQRADLKHQYSRQQPLTVGEQIIYAKAWDISDHFSKTWKGTGFKGQLIAPSKLVAVRYKRLMDQIGKVSTDVLISPPDDREGYDDAYGGIADEVVSFWKKMMDKYGNAKNYEETIRRNFKTKDVSPDIIIVVDKLLTGFDNPINVIMYLCRKLREHTLFQAITRVNRKAAGKEYGFIMDYDGIIAELAKVMEMYTENFEEYDPEDLTHTLTDVRQEVARLPQLYSDLWNLFKTISNKHDAAAFEALLDDVSIRTKFFERLAAYSKGLKLALSTFEFVTQTPESEQERYKEHLAFFQKLRRSVLGIYLLEVDYKEYESQIQKLLDTHISAEGVVPITQSFDLMDKELRDQEVANMRGAASKAHAIASRTQKTITEKMEEAPAFYKRFSEMIKDTLEDYRLERLSEVEFLQHMQEIHKNMAQKPTLGLPASIQNRVTAIAVYGLLNNEMAGKADIEIIGKWSVQLEETMVDIVTEKGVPLVDWPNKSEVVGHLRRQLDEYLYDYLSIQNERVDYQQLDRLVDDLFKVAKAHY